MAKDWTGNYHSVCGCLGAHNECKEEREEHDYYATTPKAAEWLKRLVDELPDVIRELLEEQCRADAEE